DAPARGAQPDAEVDVVEGDRQLFVESPQLLKHRPADHDAGRGRARHVLLQGAAAEIPGASARLPVTGVAGDAAKSQNNSGMLDAVVRIEQQRSGGGDAWLRHSRRQALEPLRCDDCRIVVEKAQEIAGRLACSPVVNPGIVEWTIRMD